MTPFRTDRFRSDRRATAALEFALVFPAVLLFIFGMIAVFTLIASKRAMDYGVEKALRYAAVHGGATQATVTTVFRNAATTVWRDAGTAANVTISPLPFKAGDTVQVSVTYAWAPPAGLKAPDDSAIFYAVTLSANGQMKVVN